MWEDDFFARNVFFKYARRSANFGAYRLREVVVSLREHGIA